MGEVADWIVDGGGCEWCGTVIGDGSEAGYPRLCDYCATDARRRGFTVNDRGQILARPGDTPWPEAGGRL